jgi:hypothetical protein
MRSERELHIANLNNSSPEKSLSFWKPTSREPYLESGCQSQLDADGSYEKAHGALCLNE